MLIGEPITLFDHKKEFRRRNSEGRSEEMLEGAGTTLEIGRWTEWVCGCEGLRFGETARETGAPESVGEGIVGAENGRFAGSFE